MSPRRSSHVRGAWRRAFCFRVSSFGVCLALSLGIALGLPACSFSSHGAGTGGETGAGGTGSAGTGGSAATIPGLTALRIEPNAADIMTSPAMRGSQVFHAIGTVDGQDKDVTASVRWSTTAP